MDCVATLAMTRKMPLSTPTVADNKFARLEDVTGARLWVVVLLLNGAELMWFGPEYR